MYIHIHSRSTYESYTYPLGLRQGSTGRGKTFKTWKEHFIEQLTASGVFFVVTICLFVFVRELVNILTSQLFQSFHIQIKQRAAVDISKLLVAIDFCFCTFVRNLVGMQRRSALTHFKFELRCKPTAESFYLLPQCEPSRFTIRQAFFQLRNSLSRQIHRGFYASVVVVVVVLLHCCVLPM